MKIYNHKQTSQSAQWDITHNLNTHPLVDVRIGYGRNPVEFFAVLPQKIEYLDSNTLRVIFSAAYAGEARLIG